jgi:hypothetical protein
MKKKLTDEQVVEIYKEVANGSSQSDVAKKFGVGSSIVGAIVTGKARKHLWLKPIFSVKPSYLNRGLSLPERIANGVKENTETGCLEWQRYRGKDGYGVIAATGWKPATDLTHRVAWRLKNGQIPKGQCILHKCDNPSCCNTDHLFLGSHAENMRDMKIKQRAEKGSEKHTSKLTEQKVLEIVSALKAGEMIKSLAARYGVSTKAISSIKSGETWHHLTGIIYNPKKRKATND